MKIDDKQALLEEPDVAERLERVLGLMEGEIGVLQVEKKIRSRVKRQMEKTQREYYLNEQMKAIQRELGEGDDSREELAETGRESIAEAKLSKEARTKAEAEFKQTAPDEPDVSGSHGRAQLSRLDPGSALGQAQTSQE